MKKKDENLIDHSVLFVESVFETERKSKIVTKDGIFYSRDSAMSLIDKACMLYASTYEGRVKATRHNLKQHKKTTLLISENGLAAFPTRSPDHLDCVWIFNHHYRLETLGANRTRIIYDDYNVHIDVGVSISTLQKQRSRMIEMLYFYMTVRKRQNT